MAKEEGKAWKGLQTRVLVFVTEERYHQPMAMPLHFPASLAKYLSNDRAKITRNKSGISSNIRQF